LAKFFQAFLLKFMNDFVMGHSFLALCHDVHGVLQSVTQLTKYTLINKACQPFSN
jgi:hypothetical protein